MHTSAFCHAVDSFAFDYVNMGFLGIYDLGVRIQRAAVVFFSDKQHIPVCLTMSIQEIV